MDPEIAGTVVPLRLVHSEPKPEMPYCRHSIGCRNPATVLLTFCSRVPQPCCDECARRTWESYPDNTTIGPLGDYVDHFAAAREAALAPPPATLWQYVQVPTPANSNGFIPCMQPLCARCSRCRCRWAPAERVGGRRAGGVPCARRARGRRANGCGSDVMGAC